MDLEAEFCSLKDRIYSEIPLEYNGIYNTEYDGVLDMIIKGNIIFHIEKPHGFTHFFHIFQSDANSCAISDAAIHQYARADG